MRRSGWTLLIALALGSLLVSRVVLRDLEATPSTSSPSRTSEETTAPRTVVGRRAPRTATRHAPFRTDAHAGEAESGVAAGSAEPLDLDLATADQIVDILESAVERQRQNRPLFVSPGVIETVAERRRVRVIFETGSGHPAEQVEALLAGASGVAAFSDLRVFPRLERGGASVGPQALSNLIQNPETLHIELDAIHRPSLEDSIPIIRADLSHQLGYDGDGTAVAIIDTGVDPIHPMFADRIVEEACFSLENDCPNGESEMFGPGAAVPCAISGCGHGTRVAGIAVGNEPNGTLIGAAPHANLIAIQVFSDVDGSPGAYSSDILAAYQHVLDLTAFYSIASVNLSLGGNPYTAEATCDQAVSSHFSAITLLHEVGVLTVAAAGNESFTNALTTPACLSNVIGVGSTSNADVVSSFSNSASFLSMLAPGEAVETSRNGGGSASASGTSMATPHVAGAIASIREAVPDATVTEIENALALSGLPVLDDRNGVTTPRLRMQDAIELLQVSTLPPPDPVDPPPGDGGSGTPSAATTSSSGSGGGACGLVGVEPFLVLGLVRRWRRRTAA